jgi:membrane-bound metal-dependent hydrolase YbcI (DUF457 family)
MYPLQFLVPLGPLEAAAGVLPSIILVLVLANMVTRWLAHRSYVSQAEDDDEPLSRYLPHSLLNVLLVLSGFALLIVEPHSGMVFTVLVVGMFLADFFEFEARQVEVRNALKMEYPKSAVVASLVVLLYAAFLSLFVYVQDYWNAVV